MTPKLPYGLQAEVARRATAILAERYPEASPPMRVDDSQVSRVLRYGKRSRHGELIIRVMYVALAGSLRRGVRHVRMIRETAEQVTAEMGGAK